MATASDGLEANLALVEARIREVCGAKGEKKPNFGFGMVERYREEAPPRITWVPISARRAKDKVTRGHPQKRTLYNRTWTIQARVWCETFADTEKLVRHLVAAARDEFTGFSFDYVGEQVDTGDDASLGFVDIVTFTIDLPLRDEPLAVVHPTAVAVNGSIVQPEDLS